MESKSTNLFYKEGTSDKTYQVQLSPTDGADWVVNFQYGKRGGPLKSGTKTNAPLPYSKALSIYEKLVSEKTKDGYVPTENGKIYQALPSQKEHSGIRPQLLNSVNEQRAEELLTDPAWFAQEKYDGERRCAIKQGERIIGTNRSGVIVPLTADVADAIQALPIEQITLDSEDMGDHIVVFDILQLNGVDLTHLSATARLDKLESLLSVVPTSALRCIKTYRDASEKQALLDRVKAANGEGIVFKRANSPYTPNRPASGGDQLKLKFVEPATVIVQAHNEGKRSVSIGLFDQAGTLLNVGNVTIPPNHSIPPVNSLIEVRYLYAFEASNALYQPVFDRPRTDLTAVPVQESARLSQLKYKPATTGTEQESEEYEESSIQDTSSAVVRERARG